MLSINPVFVEEDVLHLQKYEYKSGAQTPLDAVLSKLCDKTIRFVPVSLSPNAITLIGFVMNLIGVACLGLGVDEDGVTKQWAFLVYAIMAFIYVYLDFMDGKQARRLSCSSPLGQLFDHGCDCHNCTCMLYSIIRAMDIKESKSAGIMLIAAESTFIGYQLLEYYNDVLLLGVPFFGVSEIEFAVMIVSFISFCFGTSFWSQSLHDIISIIPSSFLLKDIAFYSVVLLLWGVPLLQSMYYLVKGSSIPEEKRGNKNLSCNDQFKRYVPLFTINFVVFYLSNTYIGVLYQPYLFLITSLCYSHYSLYVNIYHLMKKALPCDFQGHAILLLLCVLIRNGVEIDITMMRAITAVSCIIYSVFLMNILHTMSNALHIDVFGTKFKSAYPMCCNKY